MSSAENLSYSNDIVQLKELVSLLIRVFFDVFSILHILSLLIIDLSLDQ